MKSLIDRLKDRCRVEPATGCWIWRQAMGCNGRQPVVEISEIGAKTLNARRLMYVIAVGQLGKGKVVTSTCNEETCLNPAHLKAITRADLNRKIAKIRRYDGPAKIVPATWHPGAG